MKIDMILVHVEISYSIQSLEIEISYSNFMEIQTEKRKALGNAFDIESMCESNVPCNDFEYPNFAFHFEGEES